MSEKEVREMLAFRIKSERLNQNLSRASASEKSGVSVASLRRFESSGEISLKNLTLLARTVGRLDDFEELFKPKLPATLKAMPQNRKRGRL